jgi:hypothetical protein
MYACVYVRVCMDVCSRHITCIDGTYVKRVEDQAKELERAFVQVFGMYVCVCLCTCMYGCM